MGPSHHLLTDYGFAYTYTYDTEGQLATAKDNANAQSTRSLTFDYEHRLTAIANTLTGLGSAQFSYDGAGNRLKAVRNGTTTKYVYAAAGNLLAEADGSGAITRYYLYGLGLIALKSQSDGVYCYHFDATGNTVALTDQNQSIASTYAYQPYGEQTQGQTQTITQPFTYVGQYGVMAENYGYYYMRARYYDSGAGRFVSEDPLGFGGGDVNLYVYVAGNPVNGIDPSGLHTS